MWIETILHLRFVSLLLTEEWVRSARHAPAHFTSLPITFRAWPKFSHHSLRDPLGVFKPHGLQGVAQQPPPWGFWSARFKRRMSPVVDFSYMLHCWQVCVFIFFGKFVCLFFLASCVFVCRHSLIGQQALARNSSILGRIEPSTIRMTVSHPTMWATSGHDTLERFGYINKI
jgi:hypothetical protein